MYNLCIPWHTWYKNCPLLSTISVTQSWRASWPFAYSTNGSYLTFSGRPASERTRSCFFCGYFAKPVLDSLVRYFSRILKAKNWESHIQVRDLTKLLAVGGELGIYLKESFLKVRFVFLKERVHAKKIPSGFGSIAKSPIYGQIVLKLHGITYW